MSALPSHSTQQASGVAAARLAQSVERKALNLVVVGSSPTVGAFLPVEARGPTIPKLQLKLFRIKKQKKVFLIKY